MKTAIITGGSQGLGSELASKLAKIDYQVILIARGEEHLKEVASSIGSNASYFSCDIRNKAEVEKVIKEIEQAHGNIDLLINNAGTWTDDQLQEENPELALQSLETNILGQINITEACLDLLKQKKVTRIANIISTAGVLGIPAGDNRFWKTYGASKWGFVGYTNTLKEELRDTNIQVLQFFPGGFESNLYENAGRQDSHNQPWMMKTKNVAEIIIFALTRPDDIYMESTVFFKHMQ